MSLLPLVRIWILVSALASAAGWALSAGGQLNRAGYGGVAILSLGIFFLARAELLRDAKKISWPPLRARLARPLPLAFAGLAALVLLGGALYAPSNYDGLTYRLPRVLHWLNAGQWHWIHTANSRMNDRSCGFEWLMAPVFLATKSDRFFFLINFLPLLLLPGLVFSVFTRLGVKARVAWPWMWLLPAGYNFLLQAGSLANDTFAAVYALAAIDFALRAAASRRLSDIWLSLLAAALLTGAKSGNLPLLLPWGIAFLPLVPRFFSKPLASFGVAAVALVVSYLPTAVLNQFYCHDWSGLTLEDTSIVVKNPLVGILGNSAVLLTSNFVPTFFPLAGWWNAHILDWLPEKIHALLLANFETYFYRLGEIPTEEMAGLGFGVSALLALSVLGTRFYQTQKNAPNNSWRQRALRLSPFAALLFFFGKSGMMTLARLVSAYYPLLLPALLCGAGQSLLVRRRWWQRTAIAVMLLAIPVVVLTPARPLWPARTVLARLSSTAADHPFLHRIQEVYFTYANRPDPLAAARAALPADCQVVGFVGTSDDTEISFWRPFGQRRVEAILPADTAAQIRARHIEYAVMGEIYLTQHHQTLAAWLEEHQAAVITNFDATMTVSLGPRPWYVVRLHSADDGGK